MTNSMQVYCQCAVPVCLLLQDIDSATSLVNYAQVSISATVLVVSLMAALIKLVILMQELCMDTWSYGYFC